MIKNIENAEILVGKIIEINEGLIKCEGFSLQKHQISFSIPYIREDIQSGQTLSKYSIGDIILYSNNQLTTLYFSNSEHNAFFITEKCNNNCLMCSQPPKTDEDTSTLFKINNILLELLPLNIKSIGITGGEPTLFFDNLIELIKNITNKLPETNIHILTNGRQFNNYEKVNKLAEVNNGNVILGIPLHSDVYFEHDYIAQAQNSFYQTTKGLYNLAAKNIRVEIRIVINKQNYNRLNSISDFIYKNFPFVEHIAFMSLEYIGNATENIELIDILPTEYMEDLSASVLKLKRWGLNVSIYNIPLCMLKPTIFEFSKKSISDWKQKFSNECNICVLKKECCGLFATSKFSYNVIPFN